MQKTKIALWALILAVLISGTLVRFINLDTIPPGIHYDEAFNGLDAISNNESGNYKIFYTNNTGREGLHINVEAFFIRLFGVSNSSLRLANALWGSLTLIGFLFLLRQLKFSEIGILVGISALAFSFWHLDFSRTAYRGIMVPLILFWLFYFFLKGIEAKNHKYLYFIISGLLLGLGFHTYIAFRAAPIIFIILAVFLFSLKRNFLKDYWKSAVVFFVAFLALALPILVYFYQHQNELMVRTEAVSIFDDPKIPWIKSLARSFSTHLKAFFIEGDRNPRFNFMNQPLLPPLWQAAFLAGFFISLRELYLFFRKKNKEGKQNRLYASIIGQVTFWIMLLPGVLSIEGIPHSLRIIGTIPGVFILMALPFEYIIDFFEKKNSLDKKYNFLSKSLLAAGLISFLAIGLIQVYIYFFIWAKDPKTLGGYEKKLYDFGQLIRELPVKKNNYLILTQQAAVSNDHKESSFKTTEYIAYPKIKEYLFFKPLSKSFSVNCEEDTRIIFFESDRWLRDQYAAFCPNVKSRLVIPKNGLYGFRMIEIGK